MIETGIPFVEDAEPESKEASAETGLAGFVARTAEALSSSQSDPKPEIDSDQKTLVHNTLTFGEALKRGELPRTPSGLVDGVFLAGPTNVIWRNKGEAGDIVGGSGSLAEVGVGGGSDSLDEGDVNVVKLLEEYGILSVNPAMGKAWTYECIDYEQQAMERCSVLAIRLEAGDIDGGLGSLAEVGVAVLYGMLNGQRVLLSIDPNYRGTLQEPGAIAQFDMMMKYVQEFHKLNLVDVLAGEYGTLEKMTEVAAQWRTLQNDPRFMRQPFTARNAEVYRQKREAHLTKAGRIVVLGGTSQSYAQEGSPQANSFVHEQRLVAAMFGQGVVQLNFPPNDRDWIQAYDPNIGQEERAALLQQANDQEFKAKTLADVLVWMVQNEGVSKAAAMEVFFLFALALKTGKPFYGLLENFDGIDYLQEQLKDQFQSLKAEYTQILETTQDEAAKTDAQKVLMMLEHLENNDRDAIAKNKITPDSIAKTSLKQKVEAVRVADNATRVRKIAARHFGEIINKVQKIMGESGVELATLATEYPDFLKKVSLIGSPEAAERRIEFFNKYQRFTEVMDGMVESMVDTPPTPDMFVNTIQQAMKEVVGIEYWNKMEGPLHSHLRSVQAETRKLLGILQRYAGELGKTYLDAEDGALLSEIVAPLHDLAKIFGGPNDQALPDHEIIISLIVDRYASAFGFTDEQKGKIVAKLRDHENIFKEENRSQFAQSSSSIDRSKALFFVADVLTGVVVEEDGEIKLDPAKLWERFTDLYIRHMDKTGKIFRPLWGNYSIVDLVNTFKVWRDQYGLKLDKRLELDLIQAGLDAIEETLRRDQERRDLRAAGKYNGEKVFGFADLVQVDQLMDFELKKIEASKETLEIMKHEYQAMLLAREAKLAQAGQ